MNVCVSVSLCVSFPFTLALFSVALFQSCYFFVCFIYLFRRLLVFLYEKEKYMVWIWVGGKKGIIWEGLRKEKL